MARQFIAARYVWSWSSLTGSVLGLLAHVGLPADPVVVGSLLGDSLRSAGPHTADGAARELFAPTGYPQRSLDDLPAALQVLGLRATVHERDLTRQRPPRFLNRRLKAALNAQRPLIAFGAGRAIGPSAPPAEFGLIVGYDDDRDRSHGAYRVDGPLTEEIDAWLPFNQLGTPPDSATESASRWLAVIDATLDQPQPDHTASLARSAALAAAGPAGLQRWIQQLESDLPIDPQGHAWWAQRLAGGRAEAAQFWSGVARALPADAAAGLNPAVDLFQREALTLSTFATLHPYPTGGDIANPAGRTLAARTLIGALASEREALDRLAAAHIPDGLTLAPDH